MRSHRQHHTALTLSQLPKATTNMSSTRPELEAVEYHHYLPYGIRHVLASGSSSFIGQVDDSTEVGRHDRSIAQQGLTDGGLYLEYATNGPILDLLLESKHATVAPAADNLVQRGSRKQLCTSIPRGCHCNIDPTNILLDENPHAKLADFQGCHLGENPEVLLARSSR